MRKKPTGVRTAIASTSGAGQSAARRPGTVMPGHPAYGAAGAGAPPQPARPAVPAPGVATGPGGVMPMADYPHGRGGMAAVQMPAAGPASAAGPSRRGMPPAQRMPS
jgi:hypothetical protein